MFRAHFRRRFNRRNFLTNALSVFIGLLIIFGEAFGVQASGHPDILFPIVIFFTWVVRELSYFLAQKIIAAYIHRKKKAQEALERKVQRYALLQSSEREIRLVNILPGKPSDPIECALQPCSLGDRSESTQYEFLSYAQDDPLRTRNIRLNGYPCSVRMNLYHALKELRYLDRTRSMWIDVLSINQFDVLERNEQVALTPLIIQHASKVIIWLGKETKDSNIAFEFLQLADGQGDSLRFLQRSVGDDAHMLAWKSLRRLCNSPYWNRAWTVQEIALAPSLAVQCGSRSVMWRILALGDLTWQRERSLRLSEYSKWFHAVDKEDASPYRAFSSPGGPSMLEMTRGCFQPKSRALESIEAMPESSHDLDNSLLGLVQTYCMSEVINPQDRVYAFVGLATDRIESVFTIDYRLDVADVFQQLVEFSLLKTNRIDILGYSGKIERPRPYLIGPSTPSGLKAYSRSWLPVELSSVRPSKLHLSRINRRAPYSADGHSTADVVFKEENIERVILGDREQVSKQVMLVSGRRIGRIYKLGPELWFPYQGFFTKVSMKSVSRQIRKAFKFAQQTLESLAGTHGRSHLPVANSSFALRQRLERNLDDFWRVLVCDRTVEGAKAPEEWKAQFEAIVNTSLSDQSSEFVRPYQEAVFYYMSGCRVFVTTDGDFGVTPDGVKCSKKGDDSDELIILFGCNVPMVLSKYMEWKLSVPEGQEAAAPLEHLKYWAYLQNHMAGEGVHENELDGKSSEQFMII